MFDISSIYWERQSGDLCRLHSLNAYFGKKHFNIDNFYKLCDEYDNLVPGLCSKNMDGFAEGRSIISYILDKFDNKFVFLIPIDSNIMTQKYIRKYECNRLTPFIGNSILSYFEFNKGHVWLNKIIDGKLFKIDSLSGVNMIDIPRTLNTNGYLMVFEKKLLTLECEFYFDLLKKNSIENNKIVNKKNIIRHNYTNQNETVLYNLYYLLDKIPLNYSKDDAIYNNQITFLKQIRDNIYIFIKEMRCKIIKTNKLNNIINNIDRYIDGFDSLLH